MRGWILALGLTALYWGVVTPCRWFLRRRGFEFLPLGINPSIPSTWVPLSLDSRDKGVYRKMGGACDSRSMRSLIAEYRELVQGTPGEGKWWILAGLAPLRRLATPPEEEELQSDLYVMF